MRALSLLMGWMITLNAVAATLSSPIADNPTNETTSQITWKWADTNTSKLGFRVYDSPTGSNVLQTLGASATSWTETNVTAGARYTRYVSTYSATSESTRTQLPSAMASFPVTWHPASSSQSRAIADTYIASASPTNTFAAEDSFRCGYSSTAAIRRSLVQFEQSTLPNPTLWRAGWGRAAITLYATASGGNYGTIDAYRVSAEWDETNAVPTWNTFFTATNGKAFTEQLVQGASAAYSWPWDPLVTGMPDNRRGVMFVNRDETSSSPAKGFASKDNTSGWPAPMMSLDYYLPVNPGWVTQMLVLPGVGTNSLDAVAYATAAGLTGDTDLYGNSKLSYGGKQWRTATGDFTEVTNFSDHYGWNLTNATFGVGTNICSLFNLYVFSDTTAGGCYLRCGSDDGVRLIVNNTVVGTDDAIRTWDMEQSAFGPFTLNAGWNRVLIKVRNGTGATGLKAVRFSNADATVWSGSALRFAVDDITAPANPTGCTERGGTLSGVWQHTVSKPSFTWSGAVDNPGNNEGASGIRGYKVYFGPAADGVPASLQAAATYSPAAQGEGVCYLRVSTVDNAMNESTAVTLFTNLYDSTAPTGVSLSFGAVTPNSIAVTGTGSDSLSGIDAWSGYVFHLPGVQDSDKQGTNYTWSGLKPNTCYTNFSVAVSDLAGNTTLSATQDKWTSSLPPTAGSVVPDNGSPCAGSPVTWSAFGGFGLGTVQYYRYLWDQSPTHLWTETETRWSGGTLALTPTAGGPWYLHVKGYNGENVANGNYDYAIVVNASPMAQPKTLSTGKNQMATVSTAKLLVGATDAVRVTGAASTTPGAVVTFADGVVTYTPATDFTGTDSFTFSMVSSVGCVGTGTVTVAVGTGDGQSPKVVYAGKEGNQFVARFAGIPGETYTIEAAGSVDGPWAKLGANVTVPDADQGWGVGVFEIRDQISNGQGFYRTVWPAY